MLYVWFIFFLFRSFIFSVPIWLDDEATKRETVQDNDMVEANRKKEDGKKVKLKELAQRTHIYT